MARAPTFFAQCFGAVIHGALIGTGDIALPLGVTGRRGHTRAKGASSPFST